MPRKARISVQVGELVKPLVVHKCDKGTTIESFLNTVGITWGSNVRVNGDTVKKSYKLGDGDIITTIGHVSGGK